MTWTDCLLRLWEQGVITMRMVRGEDPLPDDAYDLAWTMLQESRTDT